MIASVGLGSHQSSGLGLDRSTLLWILACLGLLHCVITWNVVGLDPIRDTVNDPTFNGGMAIRPALLGYFEGQFILALNFLFAAYLFKKAQEFGLFAATGVTYACFLLPPIICRLVALFQAPGLSDDIFRYLWEGHVLANGFNPYIFAPGAPELEALRDSIWLGVNHKEIPAIYPPVMQLLFFAVVLAKGKFLLLKLTLVAFELACAALIWKLSKRDFSCLFFWLWSPLIIFEVAGQGHFEPVPVFFLLLAIWAYKEQRWWLLYLSLSLAIGAKYLPVVLLPLALNRKNWRWAVIVPIVLVLLFVPFLEPGFFDALKTYGRQWRFNDSGFGLIDAGLKSSGLSGWFAKTIVPQLTGQVDADFTQHQNWLLVPTKLCCALILLSTLGLCWLRRFSLERSALLFFGVFLLVTPVFHPWYLLWVLPFACLAKRQSWILLSLTIPLSYEILIRYNGNGDTWVEASWVKLSLFVPLLCLFIFDSFREYPESFQAHLTSDADPNGKRESNDAAGV